MNDKKTEVCIIVNHYVGGFKSFVDNLIKILIKNNCAVTVLNIGNKDVKASTFFNILNLNIYSKKRSKTISQTWHLFIWLIKKACMRLALFFRKNRNACLAYDVFCSQYKDAKCVFESGVTIDLSSFNCVISSEELMCNYFLSTNIIARKKIGYIHPNYNMAKFSKKIDYIFFKKIDYIFATSVANSEAIKSNFKTLAHKVLGMPNPIDIDYVIQKSNEPTSVEVEDKVINIVTVCRLDNSSKALDRLIELAKELKKSHNFIWRIVGDGDYYNQMKSLIYKYDLFDTVLLLGFVENPIPIVKESDLFVLQSYYEGYPISVCESIIVDTPVLITNYPAAQEQVEDMITGLIAENDFSSIFSKLDYALDKQKLIMMKEHLSSTSKNKFENIDCLLYAMRND